MGKREIELTFPLLLLVSVIFPGRLKHGREERGGKGEKGSSSLRLIFQVGRKIDLFFFFFFFCVCFFSRRAIRQGRSVVSGDRGEIRSARSGKRVAVDKRLVSNR